MIAPQIGRRAVTVGKANVLVCGIIGHLIALMLWFVAFKYFEFDLLKWWVNLILPMGAVCLGMVGGAGFWIGARLVAQGSTPGLKWAALGVGLVSVLVIRFAGYWTLDVDGTPVHQLIGFGAYLRETLGHARIDFSHGSSEIGKLDIGAGGYFMELLQTAAYAATSFFMVGKMPQAVRCDACNRHMEQCESGEVLRNSQIDFAAFYDGLPDIAVDRIRALRAAPSDIDGQVPGAVKLRWRLSECPTCNAAALAEDGMGHNGEYYLPVSRLGQEILFDRRRPASTEAAPAPMPARPAGFGRRVVR